MTMTDSGLSEFVTYDGSREVTFVGRKIGHASTESEKSHRWLEIDIYRTQAGAYVVEKIGMSVIYHRIGASCGSRGASEVFQQEDYRELVPCPNCKPTASVGDTIVLEREKHETFVSHTAEEMVRDLLPNVALRALRSAAHAEPELKSKFFVQEVQ